MYVWLCGCSFVEYIGSHCPSIAKLFQNLHRVHFINTNSIYEKNQSTKEAHLLCLKFCMWLKGGNDDDNDRIMNGKRNKHNNLSLSVLLCVCLFPTQKKLFGKLYTVGGKVGIYSSKNLYN